MTGTPDDLDATTETETLTTVSVGEYAGQTVAAVMVTHTVNGYGMGTPAVDVMDAAQALLVDPVRLEMLEAGPAVQLVSAPAAPVPVNVSNTDARVSGALGDVDVQADGGCGPVAGVQ